MSEVRRKRLREVLVPLTSLDDFSAEQARQTCAGTTSRYVTQLLGQLVREGVLEIHTVNRQQRYRWTRRIRDARFNQQWTEQWIDHQIHAHQIKASPATGRPRERLLREGAAALSDADLLAILIRVGVPNESAVVAGERIAHRFAERLDALARSSQSELRAISSAATPSSYAQIMAGIELGRRIALVESMRRAVPTRITNTHQAIDFCRNRFARLARDAVQEQFHIVTLDTKHKPIHTHCITVGTLDASLVHPREVFRPAIRDAAAAILLVHNHPSGDPTPSREDHRVTEQLTEAGRVLGIEVLDHIVVASEDCLSIRECAV